MTVELRPDARAGVRTVREVRVDAEFPFYVHSDWVDSLPWLTQGITGRAGPDAFDMGLFGTTSSAVTRNRWAALRRFTGSALAIHARQVHGCRVLSHQAGQHGIFVADAADGHACADPGLLLTVSVADCVPVSLVAPERRAVALLHAGWRGVAAGILEHGLATLAHGWSCAPAALLMHLGPAICAACYEVGPEVHAALGIGHPDRPQPVDLRATLASRAVAAGLPARAISLSEHCTRCGNGFHSHRGGDAERQVAVLGVRADRAR